MEADSERKCPCGCGEPVWPIPGGLSTPDKDDREAFDRALEAAPRIIAEVTSRTYGPGWPD